MNLDKLREIAQVECRLDLERPILIGVSGGPDSMCLLDVLARLGYPLIVAHFDHRLRPGSEQDGIVVQQAAERMNVPFLPGSQDVAVFAKQERLSIEAAARTLRYQFLFAQARQHNAQAVAVGHTADDQVETVLMHLLRGSGLVGLSGMAYRSHPLAWDAEIPLVRPLLAVWHAETLDYCQMHGVQAVNDESNQDPSFFRNRLRHELIPLLETYNPAIRPVLWRTARVLAGEAAVVSAAIRQAWQNCHVEEAAGAVAFSLEAIMALDVGLQRGVLRQAIARLLTDLRDVDFAAVDRGLIFLTSGCQGQVELLKGLRLFIEGDRVVIATPTATAAFIDWPQLETSASLTLDLPGQADLPDGWRLVGEWVDRNTLPDFADRLAWEAWLDADKLPGRLAVRPPRSGDRFQPLGMAGHTIKLSDFWINRKLARRARAGWPLVTAADTIAWIPGFHLAHPFRVQRETRKVLHLHLFKVSEREGTP